MLTFSLDLALSLMRIENVSTEKQPLFLSEDLSSSSSFWSSASLRALPLLNSDCEKLGASPGNSLSSLF